MSFSYGFRPGRSPHQALDALTVGIQRKKVNWILDADVMGFFDNLNHEWAIKFIEHRVADQRILRLIRKWLKAGVSEDGEWSKTDKGTPQGAVASPLIANVYLHYLFDLWADVWRRKAARGDVIIVRYADDVVCPGGDPRGSSLPGQLPLNAGQHGDVVLLAKVLSGLSQCSTRGSMAH